MSSILICLTRVRSQYQNKKVLGWPADAEATRNCKSNVLFWPRTSLQGSLICFLLSCLFLWLSFPSYSVVISHWFWSWFPQYLVYVWKVEILPVCVWMSAARFHCILQQTLFQRNKHESTYPEISENGSSHLQICMGQWGGTVHCQACLPLCLRRQSFCDQCHFC